MKITIRQPLCFTAKGRKENQEDSLYPLQGTAQATDKYFLVCDGVGGSDHGEVASNTVSQVIGNFLNSKELPDGLLTENIFNLALNQAYDALDGAYTGFADSFKKMATTLTFLGIHRGGCFIAHIGDSRVYHIRPGVGILSRTNDHSLVNDLLKAGELTPEQAKTFRQKNVITRAMQPLMEHRDQAEFTPVLQVEAGDYFFLCCDGVLEHLQEDKLVEILSNRGATDADKLAAIKKICDDGDTRDNYTCYLVPIDTVESEPDFDATLVADEVMASVEPAGMAAAVEGNTVCTAAAAATSIPAENVSIPAVNATVSQTAKPGTARPVAAPKKSSSVSMKTIAIILFVLLVACIVFIVSSTFGSKDREKEQEYPAGVPSTPAAGTGELRHVRRTESTQPEIRVETGTTTKPNEAAQPSNKARTSIQGVNLNGNTDKPSVNTPSSNTENSRAHQEDKLNGTGSNTPASGNSGGSEKPRENDSNSGKPASGSTGSSDGGLQC